MRLSPTSSSDASAMLMVMRNQIRRDPLFVGLALISILVGCAPVRLIEENDPQIEQGMTEYQKALAVFVRRTLASYESCQVYQEALDRTGEMQCVDSTEEAQQLCNVAILAEKTRLEKLARKNCEGASYEANRTDFYIEQEARISVLKTRASVLDSMGICVSAMNGVSKAVRGSVPEEISAAVGTESAARANNCTEIVVNTVLENHKSMGLTHKCIDQPNADGCPEQYQNIDLATWNSAVQAGFYFPTMLDTLVQNIRIVLFLEEAKKRGAGSDKE